MSLKVFTTTRFVRRQHHLYGRSPKTVRTNKLLARRSVRRRVRRELLGPATDAE